MADETVNVGLGMGEPENVPQLTLGAEPEENVPAIELSVEVPDTAYAKRAEAWAVGNVNGVPVPSTDPAYHNNAKWYAIQSTVEDVIDDTAGIGDDDKVWSADKMARDYQIATVAETQEIINEYEGVS